MRSTVVYYLMLLYLTVMFKPLLPILGDAFSHAFDRTHHLTHVHGDHGHHHVEKEIAATASEDDKTKNQPVQKTQEPIPLHVSPDANRFAFLIYIHNRMYAALDGIRIPAVFLFSAFPPPRFS